MYRGICTPCCWWRKWCGAARMVPMQARREANFQCWWIKSKRLKTGLGLAGQRRCRLAGRWRITKC